MSYVTPMISKRLPVLLLTKFEPSMLTYWTADAKEANSVAAVAKEACVFIVGYVNLWRSKGTRLEWRVLGRGTVSAWMPLWWNEASKRRRNALSRLCQTSDVKEDSCCSCQEFPKEERE